MGIWRELKYSLRRIKRIKKLEQQYQNVEAINDSYKDEKISFPYYENPLVSIIIPYFNQEIYTWNCLYSIWKNLPKTSFEIVLVNDKSTENPDFSSAENIRIINNKENLGFLKSVNNAISQAKGEYVYLLNNDTIVRNGFLDELLFVFDNFPNVGAVGSMLLNADGSLQEAGSVFMKDCRISQVVGKKKSYYPEFNYIYKVDYCSGCSLLLKKYDDNGNLNLFDEQFAPAYFEETDLCFRLKYIQGKDIYYTPISKIIHFNGVSYNSDISLSARKQELFDKNLKLFKKKWKKEIDAIKAEKTQSRILELHQNKSIVFYNGMVPEYDKNSGELRLTEIIKAYKRKGYFVAIVAKKNKIDFSYNEYFQRLGVCVYYEHKIYDDRLSFLKRLRLRKPISWFYAVKIFIDNYRLAQKANSDTVLIYDMVDIHHLRYQRAIQLEPKRFSNKKNFYKFLYLEKKASQKADLVVTVSEDEEKYMQKFANKDKLLTISNIHYPKKTIEEVLSFYERENILFVGSIHPPNVDAVEFLINEIMPIVWTKNNSIGVNIVGNVNEVMKEIVHPNVKFLGYVPDMEEILLKSKIMVAPLRYGAGVKGKIGQAFEYFLPVVTTPIGAEGMKLENHKNAIIAENKEDFAEAILNLYSNEDLWKTLQNNSEDSLFPFSKENLENKIDLIEKNLL